VSDGENIALRGRQEHINVHSITEAKEATIAAMIASNSGGRARGH
jgi:hypothetical protein